MDDRAARTPGGSNDKARNDRLHRFAHDLKNRLNGLGAAFRMLDELPGGRERDEVRSYAERTYFKALYEVEELMEDMGVERGPGTSRPEPIDLCELVRRNVAGLNFRFERKQQRIIFDLPQALPINSDPELLDQIVSTLLSNATKFSPEGSAITMKAVRQSDGIALSITDEGVGLTTEDLQQVFKAYAWLSSASTAGEEQGRGSLARAQRAAKPIDGRIEAHSAGPGKGSTFTLHLRAS